MDDTVTADQIKTPKGGMMSAALAHQWTGNAYRRGLMHGMAIMTLIGSLLFATMGWAAVPPDSIVGSPKVAEKSLMMPKKRCGYHILAVPAVMHVESRQIRRIEQLANHGYPMSFLPVPCNEFEDMMKNMTDENGNMKW